MVFIPKGKRLLVPVMLGLLLTTAHTTPLRAEERPADNLTVPSTEQSVAMPGVEGIASYYAKRYNNRRTNSGQRYNAAKLTAAHPTLPHGTRVKVINLANSKEVTVTVNDRCRPRSKPFIDLSRAAAKQLGFLGKGMTRVRIIPLDAETDS